jgi:GT2 family glycosyltransferase
MKIQIVTVTRGEFHPWVVNALGNNIYELAKRDIEVLPLVTYDQMPVSHARNLACEYFLESKADYLFFLDSDIILQRETITKLVNVAEGFDSRFSIEMVLASGKPKIVSGWYPLRRKPEFSSLSRLDFDQTKIKFPPDPTMFPPFKAVETKYVREVSEQVGIPSLYNFDGVGAGCLLINREALIKLEQPWFLFDPEARFGEDLYFSLNAMCHGIKIIVDLYQNVQHLHWVKLE